MTTSGPSRDLSLSLFAGMRLPLMDEHSEQVALGIVYRPDRHAILVIERSDLTGGLRWVFPGGKISPNDGGSACRAAAREVREETGVVVKLGSPRPKSDRCRAVRFYARQHPVTLAQIHYCLLEYRSGQAQNIEMTKHTAVMWWSPETVLEKLGHMLAPPVADRINMLSKAGPIDRPRRRARTAAPWLLPLVAGSKRQKSLSQA